MCSVFSRQLGCQLAYVQRSYTTRGFGHRVLARSFVQEWRVLQLREERKEQAEEMVKLWKTNHEEWLRKSKEGWKARHEQHRAKRKVGMCNRL